MARRKSIKVLRDADAIMHLLTGKHLKDVTARAVEVFGEELVNKLIKEPARKASPDDPYTILEALPEHSDFVIKAIHRAKAKVYHPDNKETGNAEEFKRIQEAYEKIMKDRKSD